MNQRPWEIYTLSDPRSMEVRYVGVTFRHKQRYNEHISRAIAGGKTHRDCWIRSLISAGIRPLYQVTQSGTGEGWQEAERHWIAFYRTQFDLTNLTDGGDGTPGIVPSPELRQKWSKMRAGTKYARGRVSAMKGKKHSPEAVEKIRKAGTGRKHSEEAKKKMGEIAKKRGISPELQARLIAASNTTKQTDEFKRQAIASHAFQSKQIVCVETGEIFPSIRTAARAIGASKSAVQFALQRNTPCKGYTLKLL